MTTQKKQGGGDVRPVMGSRSLRVVRRDLLVQTDEGDGENEGGEKGKDSVRFNVEDQYDCEKKSNNQQREGLHSASNPLV